MTMTTLYKFSKKVTGADCFIIGVVVGLFGIAIQQIAEPFTLSGLPIDFSHWANSVWMIGFFITSGGGVMSFIALFSSETKQSNEDQL